MKFILCLILVAGVSAGINEQLRFKDQGLLRTSSRASNQVAGDTRKDTRNPAEKDKRYVCKHVVKGILSQGAAGKGGKFLCNTPLIKQKIAKTIGAKIQEIEAKGRAAIEKLREDATKNQDTVFAAVEGVSESIFNYLRVPEGVQTMITNAAHGAASSLTDVPNEMYSNSIDKKETELNQKIDQMEKLTGKEGVSCDQTLNSIKMLFDHVFKAGKLADGIILPAAMKVLMPYQLLQFISGDGGEKAKKFLADAICCYVGISGNPDSGCPKPPLEPKSGLNSWFMKKMGSKAPV